MATNFCQANSADIYLAIDPTIDFNSAKKTSAEIRKVISDQEDKQQTEAEFTMYGINDEDIPIPEAVIFVRLRAQLNHHLDHYANSTFNSCHTS
jgi:hypothetical protein